MGAELSTFRVTEGDSPQEGDEPTVPADVDPHADVSEYRVFTLYPAQFSPAGDAFELLQLAPLSKLYSVLNPGIVGGAVTVKAPQPALTVGAGGAGGKITTDTGSLSQVEPPVEPAVTVPQVAATTYLALMV